jgi:hypothetical protein
MPFSTRCIISEDREPIFPDRCVVCGKERPGATTKFFSKRFVGGGRTTEILKGWSALVVPACPGCANRTRWQWPLLGALEIGGIAGGTLWILLALGYRDEASLAGICLLQVAVMMIALIVVTHYALPFQVGGHSNTMWYGFRHRQTAEEFAKLNGLTLRLGRFVESPAPVVAGRPRTLPRREAPPA